MASCDGGPVRLSGFGAESAERQAKLEARLLDASSVKRIADHRKALAGEENASREEYLAAAFAEAGFDSIEVHHYDVVLSDSTVRRSVAVIGLMVGSEWPDQWVMAGSGREDGPGHQGGSVGAATLIESARIIGRHARGSRRPRRTIAMASWGPFGRHPLEDQKLGRTLTDGVVGYLHLGPQEGDGFRASGSHSHQPLINDIARRVDAPGGDASIYAGWRQGAAVVDHGGWTDVRMDSAESEAAYGPFLAQLGIPSLGLQFGPVGGVDDVSSLQTAEPLAEMSSLYLTRMANADVPPLDYTATTESIERALDRLRDEAATHRVRLRLRGLREAVASLGFNAAAANAAADALLSVSREDRPEVTDLVDELAELLVDVEAGFLVPDTVSGMWGLRHQVYAAERGGPMLPLIRSAVLAGDQARAQAAVEQLESSLRVQIERLRIFLDKARVATERSEAADTVPS